MLNILVEKRLTVIKRHLSKVRACLRMLQPLARAHREPAPASLLCLLTVSLTIQILTLMLAVTILAHVEVAKSLRTATAETGKNG